MSSGGGVDNYSNADWDSCGNIYSKKIFNFRSPILYYDDCACCVLSNGTVGLNNSWGISNSYGMIYTTNKNIYRSPIISFNNNYAYLVELDGLVFNYNWDFGNSCGHFLS